MSEPQENLTTAKTVSKKNSGWIKLHRSMLNHPIWLSEPFSRGQAWIDLLLLANHEEKDFLLGNEIIRAGRGEVVTSQLKLAERWHWSRGQVQRFLKLLKSVHMLEQKASTKRAHLILVNYDKFQSLEETDLDDASTPCAQDEHSVIMKRALHEHKQELKELIRTIQEGSIPLPPSLNTDLVKQRLKEWIEYRAKIRKPYKTPNGVLSAIKDYEGRGAARFAAAIKYSMDKEYQGIFEEKRGTSPPTSAAQRNQDATTAAMAEIFKQTRGMHDT